MAFAAPCDVSTLQRRTPLDFARLGQGFARHPLFALSSTEECRVSSNRAPCDGASGGQPPPQQPGFDQGWMSVDRQDFVPGFVVVDARSLSCRSGFPAFS